MLQKYIGDIVQLPGRLVILFAQKEQPSNTFILPEP